MYRYVTTAQRDITPEDTIKFFGFLFHSFYVAVHLTAPVYKFLVTGEVNTHPPPPHNVLYSATFSLAAKIRLQ